jgi:hypothetical protein
MQISNIKYKIPLIKPILKLYLLAATIELLIIPNKAIISNNDFLLNLC